MLPFLGLFQSRWRVPRDEEQSSHRVHAAEGCMEGGKRMG